MSWIKTIPYSDAAGELKKIYDRLKGSNNNIDNVLLIHSLRPHTLTGHMNLYKHVLHSRNNTLPKWYLETLGVYVSHLNHCSYCVEHHSAGLNRLLSDNVKYKAILTSLKSGQPDDYFEGYLLQGLDYAKKLTLTHHLIKEEDILHLRASGFKDGEILEINQVVSYFNYVNRTVVGLGVNTKGDILGLSPNDNNDPNNWSHA